MPQLLLIGWYITVDCGAQHWKLPMEVAKKNKSKKPDGPAKGSKSVDFE
jgi:hypothetical protein